MTNSYTPIKLLACEACFCLAEYNLESEKFIGAKSSPIEEERNATADFIKDVSPRQVQLELEEPDRD